MISDHINWNPISDPRTPHLAAKQTGWQLSGNYLTMPSNQTHSKATLDFLVFFHLVFEDKRGKGQDEANFRH